MTATLYIIKDADGYRFGGSPVVRLWEPESISRTWIRKVVVELPEGFYVSKNIYDEPMIFCGDEQYELAANKKEEPVIIDHTNNGAYIPLTIVKEGWD